MCSFPLKVQDSVCSFQMFKTGSPLYKLQRLACLEHLETAVTILHLERETAHHRRTNRHCRPIPLPCPALYISISDFMKTWDDFSANRKKYLATFDEWGDDFMIDFWLKNPKSNREKAVNDMDILHLTDDDTSEDTFKKSKIPVINFQRKVNRNKGYECHDYEGK